MRLNDVWIHLCSLTNKTHAQKCSGEFKWLSGKKRDMKTQGMEKRKMFVCLFFASLFLLVCFCLFVFVLFFVFIFRKLRVIVIMLKSSMSHVKFDCVHDRILHFFYFVHFFYMFMRGRRELIVSKQAKLYG